MGAFIPYMHREAYLQGFDSENSTTIQATTEAGREESQYDEENSAG
jgi:hypothetical protein